MNYHKPVLLQEVINTLLPDSHKVFLDCTLGNGGHTLELLKKGAYVYGLDYDPSNLKKATNRIEEEGLSKKFTPILSNFNQLEEIIKTKIDKPIDGVLFDLGLSSNQQTSQNRGFSFNDSESLDMRLNPEVQEITAEEIINTADFDTLYDIFTKYSQEKFSKPIILRIIRERQKSPIKNATRLADIARVYYQEHKIKSKIDPATKIFMALRIAVNNELENIKNVLLSTPKIFKPGTTIAVISFHSGEDRIVKQTIRKLILDNKIEAKSLKPTLPTYQETKENPLSRSAVLRSFTIR